MNTCNASPRAFCHFKGEKAKMKIIDYMRADSPISGHSAEWHFFRAYVETAFRTSTFNEGERLDSEYSMDDLPESTWESMLKDCASFYAANRWHIHCDDAPLSVECEGSTAAREAAMAGYDLWLTRCGHGAGFWDGDWPEPAATILTQAAEKLGNIDLYVGDDGLIYA